jgi:hypothetical protein
MTDSYYDARYWQELWIGSGGPFGVSCPSCGLPRHVRVRPFFEARVDNIDEVRETVSVPNL